MNRKPKIHRILLADDDIEFTGMLQEYLTAEGFSVAAAGDGEAALKRLRGERFDGVVLDVMMPGMNGFDVLRELRRDSRIPVLMLTAKGDDVDSIIGLELGADDYLAKPCNPRVLVARIRAILRRAGTHAEDDKERLSAVPLKQGNLVLYPGSRRIVLDGKPLAATSTEYSVLEVLMREAGQVVSRADLSMRALGRELTRYDRSLDMHISNLRKRLGPLPNGEERIKTVRGVGYQFIQS